MLRGNSAWTTILWLVPYTCDMIRGNVWPTDSEYHVTLGSFCFLVATVLACEVLLRWYRDQILQGGYRQIIKKVRRNSDALTNNLERPLE